MNREQFEKVKLLTTKIIISCCVFFYRLVKVGVITPFPVYRNVPVPVKQIVKVPIHIPHPVAVERRVSIFSIFLLIHLTFIIRKFALFDLPLDSRKLTKIRGNLTIQIRKLL